MSESDPAKKWFHCTDGERAAFEAGIKLGALYHQFIGAAVNPKAVETMERAMEASLEAQPFVRSAKVQLDREVIARVKGAFAYSSLTPEMLRAEVTVAYGRARAVARLEFVPELAYPLMSLSELKS